MAGPLVGMLHVAVGGGHRGGDRRRQVAQAVQVQFLRLLPGEAVATEVAVAAGRLVDGLAQLQLPVFGIAKMGLEPIIMRKKERNQFASL